MLLQSKLGEPHIIQLATRDAGAVEPAMGSALHTVDSDDKGFSNRMP